MTSPANERPPLYRSRSGLLLGVCAGLAKHFQIDTVWVRLLAILGFFFTGLWPMLGIYVLTAMIMRPEPALPLSDDTEEEFYNSYSTDRHAALQRIKRTYDNLDRRLRRMEDAVTSRERDWEKRLQS